MLKASACYVKAISVFSLYELGPNIPQMYVVVSAISLPATSTVSTRNVPQLTSFGSMLAWHS